MTKAKHSNILAPDILNPSILNGHALCDQAAELLKGLTSRFEILFNLLKIQLKKCPSIDHEKALKKLLNLYDSGALVNLFVMGFNIFLNQHIYGKLVLSSILFVSFFILSCLGLILLNQLKVQSVSSFTKQCRPIQEPLTSHSQESIDVSVNLKNFIPKISPNHGEIPKSLELQSIEIEETTQISDEGKKQTVERVRLVYRRLNQNVFWSLYRLIVKGNQETLLRKFNLEK
ncbi:BA75_01192T0 [Komagataella pastoris]|uniref:BA75_01192T0 n=1 Tax=Komagataella pastoris TaxID=4922 RepID=A0A1B2J7I2_PICPA|nr:BA75_01192T0 [Komagataella pastoris]